MKNKAKKKLQIAWKKEKFTHSAINFCGQNICFSYTLSFYIILPTSFVDNLVLK